MQATTVTLQTHDRSEAAVPNPWQSFALEDLIFIPTLSNSNVPPYLKIIFEKGRLTSGLVSMLQQAPVAAFKPLSLQSSSLPTVLHSNSGAGVMQLPLTPWL